MNPTEYGYYFGEGRVQVTSQNVWQLIDEAVTEAEALDVHDVMVGPMKNLLALDYLDEEDVEDMQADDCLTPQRIVELVEERHWEAIWGEAQLDQRAIESFPRDAPIEGYPSMGERAHRARSGVWVHWQRPITCSVFRGRVDVWSKQP